MHAAMQWFHSGTGGAIAVQMLSTVLWTLNFLALARAAVEVCAGRAPERRSFDGAPSVGMAS